MAEKRKRTVDDVKAVRHDGPKKKQKRGFVVGPDNLPDGAYKRKTQKIKKSLIQRAQIKKDYAKLKRQGKVSDENEGLPKPASALVESHLEDDDDFDGFDDLDANPHPDRQTLIEAPDQTQDQDQDQDERQANWPSGRKRKPKPVPFQKEHEKAQRRKAEAEERRQAREEAERQRQAKLEERERFRKAMAKARSGGPNGQRKLGRESKVLLEKVKRMVG